MVQIIPEMSAQLADRELVESMYQLHNPSGMYHRGIHQTQDPHLDF